MHAFQSATFWNARILERTRFPAQEFFVCMHFGPHFAWSQLKTKTKSSLGDSAWNHLLSSFCAGLCACLASSPVDVVRTRLMDQRKLRSVSSGHRGGHQQIYKSSLDCGWSTLKSEGLSGLYRGFVPSFMRMGPWNIIFFLVYEQLKASFWPPLPSLIYQRQLFWMIWLA